MVFPEPEFSLVVSARTTFGMVSFTTSLVILLASFNTLVDGGQVECCPEAATVDLTSARRNASGFLSETGLFFSLGTTRLLDAVPIGCVCDLKPCLALCNAVGNDTDGVSPLPDDFHVFVWQPCSGKSAYFLDPRKRPDDEFRLLDNGSLFLPRITDPEHRFLDFTRFCFKLRGNDTFYTPRVCSPEVREDPLVRVKYIGALVGVPFLLATVLVYSILPELRNIHGTTLRCYLCCLVLTYVTLAIDRIPEPDFTAGASCLFLGFTIYFSFLASFFWLNVMCFDMWRRFGGFGSLRGGGTQSEGKKFIGYSTYAWGSALVLTAICIGMEFSPGIPQASVFHPGFRSRACWFGSDAATALYFIGPAGLTIACNVCFFVATSIKIVQHKTSIGRQLNTGDSRRHDQNKQWFALYVKLFVVMGITWSTEIISWSWEGPKYLWLITDMVNALQGLLIFVIFVCKKNICKSLKKRFQKLRRRNDSPATTASMDDSSTRCKISVFALTDKSRSLSPTAITEPKTPNDSR